MAIVDYTYYSVTYAGESIAAADFTRAEAKAERIIKQITHGRATEDAFDDLPEFAQLAVKEAICAQVEYYAIMGTDVSVNGDTAGGWTVGKVTVSGASTGQKTASGTTLVCAAAIAALEQTGLLDPSVPTLGEPPRVPWPWGVI